MNFGASDIQKGMTVYGSNGDKIGSVAQCWADVNIPTAAGNPAAPGVNPPASGLGAPTAATPISMGYFEVDQGGILGIGAKKLYVPFSAVDDIVPGDNLTLNCAKDQCDNLYANKPDFLDQTS